ncbi:MFS transporter [Microterricola pindariensis]|uniref:Major facilitator superfamily (MFS) profile domain-containing protein n=1 Tax=Microterricola pindariensis TaxID=478010 RepID=A0ABX5ATC3_9MICO|nr:MFS transporter [Microterricola pindariensis]PPL15649.1 hypothetical protein GY24_13940 [Microterricola pindariensis]
MIAALLVGVNLRPAITSVAALVGEVTAHFELSAGAVTALVTLPVIAFGFTAPLGPWLARRIGVAGALGWAMVALAAAIALRVLLPGQLLLGTAVVGIAIMAAGTLLPQYLKSLNAGGLWVGLSSMSFGVGAALGAGLAVPLHRATGESVPAALAIWAVPAIAAALAMGLVGARAGRERRELTAQRARALPRLRLPAGGVHTLALVTLVFGLQALLYFAVTAWLPVFLADRGEPTAVRGWLLAWFSIAGFLPTLVTPIIARRPRVLRWFGPGLGLAVAIGLAWLFVADGGQYLVVVGLLGAVQSAAFGLAISLIVGLSANAATAGAVSAIGQGVGYILAGAGSLLVGVVHTASGEWAPSFLLMGALAISLSVATALLVRRPPIDMVAADAEANAQADAGAAPGGRGEPAGRS